MDCLGEIRYLKATMQTTYCFHLGREQDLSELELRAVFGPNIKRHGDMALLDHEPFANAKTVLDGLGGCIKLSEVWAESETQEAMVKGMADRLIELLPEGKMIFGLSVFPQDERFLKNILKKIKLELREHGRNGRFLNQMGNLTSAVIEKGGLLRTMTDFNILKVEGKILISQTLAVQDFAGYSLRDYEKPVRLAKQGMLPPKLAQMMINLAGLATKEINFGGKTLYDPFCGSGTILGEAILKGMNVIGSDRDPIAMDAAQKNLNWFKQTPFFAEKGAADRNVDLFIADATELTKKDLPTPPDLVVSETYLGPPMHMSMPEADIFKTHSKLLGLYEHMLRTLHPLLKPGTPLVFAFPIHYTYKNTFPINGLKAMIGTCGYTVHHAVRYHRQDQAVGREIFVLELT